MPRQTIAESLSSEIVKVLAVVAHLNPTDRECVLKACLKASREQRYFSRQLSYPEEWRPVLRVGYGQYVVSNWGFVRHARKTEGKPLRPAFEHDYARAPLNAPHRSNGAVQHMIHELVFESFVLEFPIPEEYRDQKNFQVINHLNGDKYDPSRFNLELTDQGKNMEHAYRTGLRNPRT